MFCVSISAAFWYFGVIFGGSVIFIILGVDEYKLLKINIFDFFSLWCCDVSL